MRGSETGADNYELRSSRYEILELSGKKNCGNKNVQDKQYVEQLNKELMNQMINKYNTAQKQRWKI